MLGMRETQVLSYGSQHGSKPREENLGLTYRKLERIGKVKEEILAEWATAWKFE